MKEISEELQKELDMLIQAPVATQNRPVMAT